MNQSQKVKSFFERPEGNTGLIFIGAIIVGLFTAGYYLLPTIIEILQNTIHAMILGGVIFSVVTLLMNDNFRFLCSSAFKSTMRWITGWFIAIDPIGILKNYIEDMKEKIAQVEQNIIALSGQIQKIKASISERMSNVDQFLRLAKKAQEKGQADFMQLNSNKAAREKEFADKQQAMLDKMTLMHDILSKMKKNVSLLLEDTEHEVSIKESEYESIKAAYKAMKGAKALIEGDKQKEMFEQSLEYIASDIGMKIGEMDRFMETSQDFLNTSDLNNAVFNEKGLELLEQWKNDSTLLSYKSNKVRVSDPFEPSESDSLEQLNNKTTTNNSFSSIFSK
jgi:phage shock protein A